VEQPRPRTVRCRRGRRHQFRYDQQVHPFREGNGWSSRIFLQQCTSGGRFALDFAMVDRQSERWNEASRLSVPRHYGGLPEPDPLRGIFQEIVVTADPHEVAGVEDDDGMDAVRASFPGPGTEAVRTPPELGTPHARSRPGNKTMGAARTTGGNGTGGRCDGHGGR